MPRVEKGNFGVVDFDQYMLKCDYRHKDLCMVYSRDEKVKCRRKNCPYVLWFFDKVMIDENDEPYKPVYIS